MPPLSRTCAGGQRAFKHSLHEALLLVCGVYLLSPLFQTLTGTISDDTIIFLVCFSLILHLFLHSYRCGTASVVWKAQNWFHAQRASPSSTQGAAVSNNVCRIQFVSWLCHIRVSVARKSIARSRPHFRSHDFFFRGAGALRRSVQLPPLPEHFWGLLS